MFLGILRQNYYYILVFSRSFISVIFLGHVQQPHRKLVEMSCSKNAVRRRDSHSSVGHSESYRSGKTSEFLKGRHSSKERLSRNCSDMVDLEKGLTLNDNGARKSAARRSTHCLEPSCSNWYGRCDNVKEGEKSNGGEFSGLVQRISCDMKCSVRKHDGHQYRTGSKKKFASEGTKYHRLSCPGRLLDSYSFNKGSPYFCGDVPMEGLTLRPIFVFFFYVLPLVVYGVDV